MEPKDYPGGLTRHVRDPKVWKQDGVYYMVLGARTVEDAGAALVFESKDKFQWKHINTIRTPAVFGYMWECPDLFEMDGQWFLAVSPQGVPGKGPGFENIYASGYFPLFGDFRGDCRLGEFVPFDFGFDFYAPQTFPDGGRRLLIGWMGMPDAEYSNPTAAQGWQHCLTVPRVLECRRNRLVMNPVPELGGLREGSREYDFEGEKMIDLPLLSDITLTVREGGWGRGNRTAPVRELRKLRVLADTSALEFFANDGEAVLSVRWYPESERRTLTLKGRGKAVVHKLRPMQIKEYSPE